MPTRIVLADDHPIVLDGLEQLFALERDFEIVHRCSDGEATLEAVRRLRPEVLVLDIRMPKRDGLSVLRDIVADKLPTQVVLLTAELSEEETLEAVRLGVGGIVLKEMAPRLLVQCVRKVSEGERWLDQTAIRKALDRVLRREAGLGEASRLLTPREIEIVKMVAVGLRNKQIAEKLTITEGTVKIHLHSIYEKLQISGRVELSLYARDKALV
ncbi:MAG TPA: response regulator transcription factor [Thermoanaerobaculia bacterium]|nr:response regulator transcription factor [Thermoanaerobaculia bacterium]